MPDLKPIFIPQITDENSQWEKDFAKAFQSLSDDLRGIFSTTGYFIDRGDPSTIDFDENDLTRDGEWHELNLSSIVPSTAKLVLLRVDMSATSSNKYLSFRKHGSAYVYSRASIVSQVANIPIAGDLVVPIGEDGIIEYFATSTAINSFNVMICGWWL